MCVLWKNALRGKLLAITGNNNLRTISARTQ